MNSFQAENLKIHLDCNGADTYQKTSYPVCYGRYDDVDTGGHRFRFDPNGTIKTIQGKSDHWPHPAEWLKRTAANDWIYYSAGSYNDVFDLIGEYYLPCLSYESNAVRGGNPFLYPEVAQGIVALSKLSRQARRLVRNDFPGPLKRFLLRISENRPADLAEKKRRFHSISGIPISVLPPDTRHVDYDVIPVMIADGCLYRCRFCCVKTHHPFRVRSRSDISRQIDRLASFFAKNLQNQSAVFLGNHDALNAEADRILYAAETAFKDLAMERSYMKSKYLFLFGSVDSLLNAESALFERLSRLPYETYVNVGLESADPDTLKMLGKPISAERVQLAFDRMKQINSEYRNVEITANFVIGAGLPDRHIPSCLELVRDRFDRPSPKGAVYFSPLNGTTDKARVLKEFTAIKSLSRLPAYMYIIQRL